MDSKKEQLLEKYWLAESSLEEEQELKALVAAEESNESNEELKALFDHFDSEVKMELGADFDEEVLAAITAEPETKVINMATYFKRYISVAAAAVVVLVSSYLFMQNQNSYTQEDTFDSPEAAYAELKKQLSAFAMYMDKGNAKISEMSNLGSKADETFQNLGKLNKASETMGNLGRLNSASENMFGTLSQMDLKD